MARFLVTFACYLMIGEEWEQIEQMPNGKQSRKRWQVGTMIDPDRASPLFTEGYMNSPDGVIISTRQDDKFPNDYVFKGPIHPEWEPLDEEARKLQQMAPRGIAPMSEEALPTAIVAPLEPKAKDEVDPLAELKKQMAQLAGELSLLRGERDELRDQNRQLRTQLADPEEPMPAPTDATAPPAQPSLM